MIRRISKQKQEKIKNWEWERDFFIKVWNEREHICWICGKYILEPMTYCFAHIVPKSISKKHRLNINNIFIVCSINCHNSFDSKVDGKRYELERKLNEWFNILNYINQ